MWIFAKLIAFSLAKKVVVFTVAKTYGFPRLYRRMVEVNRKLISNPGRQKSIQEAMKYSFRFPKKMVDYFSSRVKKKA